MNILVTGGAGYIGSHVVLELAKTKHQLVVYDNLQKGHRQSVLHGEFVLGDLNDQQKLRQVCHEHKIEAIIHFAADSLVGESMQDPGKYYRNNVGNAIGLLEVMRLEGIQNFILSSTAAVYGEPDSVPITENHLPKPTNVYGKTKLFIETMLNDYNYAHGLQYVALRYFNACGADSSGKIGEDHTPETHLIPLVLQTLLGIRQEIRIFGNDYPTKDGTCIRDYIHVNDLAQAHILALEALSSGMKSGIYNLGNGEGYSVKEVIETAKKVTLKDMRVVQDVRRAGDPAILIASSDLAKKDLGWQPQYGDLEYIIKTAWNWHEKHPMGYVGS